MADFNIISFIQNNMPTLVPSVQVVAGAVISTMFLRKKKSIETGTTEFEKIKAEKLGETAEMLLRAGRITYTEYFKMNNYAEIARKADELRKEQWREIPQQDFDWHIRFYEACGNVTNEDMQNIWAKLLSGEINQPGSYSFRTLECLKNLTTKEAKLFEKVCRYSAKMGGNVFFPRFGDIMYKNNITYDDIIDLDDCGLLKSDSGMNIRMSVGLDFAIIASDNKFVLLVKKRRKDNRNYLEMPDYLFTAVGAELYSVVGGEMDIISLCRILQNEYQDFEFACGQIISRNGEQITYSVITADINKMSQETGNE